MEHTRIVENGRAFKATSPWHKTAKTLTVVKTYYHVRKGYCFAEITAVDSRGKEYYDCHLNGVNYLFPSWTPVNGRGHLYWCR